MHPSEEIYRQKSNRLAGKTIVLGITGSIAAVDSFHLIRELIRHGAKVVPVMTEDAAKIAAPDAIEFASGMKPILSIGGQCEHILHLGDPADADLFIVYPATADCISKMANGIADNPVTTFASVALGSGLPVAVAPAMHGFMYSNPAVSKNIEALRSYGVNIIGPHTDDNRARVSSIQEVSAWAIRLLSRDDLEGKRMLIIGGRSEEGLDSMRLITNRSTGLMAVTLARSAFERGADVELWMGACNVDLPDFIPVRRYESVIDLIDMIPEVDHDIVIVPAALADFRPEKQVPGKIPSDKGFDLTMTPVPKVLPLLRGKCSKVIGFKAESGLSEADLVARARKRLTEYNLSAVVANDIDAAGKTSASMLLVTDDGVTDISGSKTASSDGILNFVSEKL